MLKKGISGRKRKNRTSPLQSAFSNYSEYKVLFYASNFEL